MHATRPPNCCLTKEETKEIIKVLDKERRDTTRPIVLHQRNVKREKLKKVPTRSAINKYISIAPGKIEEMLDELEADVMQTGTRALLYGYLTAYWACLTGHSPSVFINMTEDDVATAIKEDRGRRPHPC